MVHETHNETHNPSEVTCSSTRCEMTWIVMPGQCNALGTVFGGQVMAWIDVCAAVSAQRFCRGPVVTAAIDGVIFRQPIQLGQVVVLQAMVNWSGRTSMEVGVRVEAEDTTAGSRVHTSSAYLTFVALDEHKHPVAVPTLLPKAPVERRRWDDAVRRRAIRLDARNRERERVRGVR